ncbi:MAG: ABC transporter permease [Chloroflexi bacterium]|nr:ABC transporter permease [Chloroflexota bacterium]
MTVPRQTVSDPSFDTDEGLEEALAQQPIPDAAWDSALPGPWPRRVQKALTNRDVVILLVCLALFAFFTALNPRMASPDTLLSIARRVAPLGVVAVGMTFLLIAGEIDLSIGGIYGFLMVLISIMIEKRHVDPWLSVAVVLALGVAFGSLNGWLVTRIGLPSFIATLGIWVALTGAADVLSGGIATSATNTSLSYYQFFGSNVPGTRVPTIFALMIVCALIGGVILATTRFGSDVYATGGDTEAARNNGIATARIKWLCFTMTGVLAAFASVLEFGRIANAPANGGTGFELQVIAGVIIGGVGLFGGRGTVFGSIVGIIILSMLASGLILIGVTQYWDGVASAIVILGAVGLDRLVRRTGIRWSEQPV